MLGGNLGSLLYGDVSVMCVSNVEKLKAAVRHYIRWRISSKQSAYKLYSQHLKHFYSPVTIIYSWHKIVYLSNRLFGYY